MLKNIKNKLKSIKGSSEIVVILITIVIFAVVALFVSRSIGTSAKTGGDKVSASITNSISSADSFASNGEWTTTTNP